MEETGCEIICGAPTTLAVEIGEMMMRDKTLQNVKDIQNGDLPRSQ